MIVGFCAADTGILLLMIPNDADPIRGPQTPKSLYTDPDAAEAQQLRQRLYPEDAAQVGLSRLRKDLSRPSP